MTTLGLDVDSVLCDSIPGLLCRINCQQGTHLEKSDVVQWDLPIGSSSIGPLIFEAFRDPVFVRTLPPMDGAVEAVKHLAMDFDIIVITSRNQSTRGATRAWVEHFFGPLPIVHASGHTKSGFGADILVDDGPHNVLAFAEGGQPAILFDQPWNQNILLHPLIWRCENWPQVHRAIYAHALPAAAFRVV